MEETKDTQLRIIEAFSSNGCPLCILLQRDELDCLWHWVGLSDESDKDSEERKRLLTAGGFCNYHFWGFQKVNTHYGGAGIAAQLIGQLLEVLRIHKQMNIADAIKHQERRSEIGQIDNTINCPICCELNEKETVYFKELLAILESDDYKSRYEKSCGLCIPHYKKSVSYITDNLLLKFLFEAQIDQLKKIKIDTDGFIRKREPPLRWEQTQDEQKSWFRAIEKIIGRSGIKGEI